MAAKRGRKPADKGPVVEPLADVPDPPEHLGEIAAQYWRSLAPQLVEIRALTAVHLQSFATLCDQWEVYRQTSDYLAADPGRWYQTVGNGGYQQVAPQVGVRERALSNLQKLWPKFGLTPEAMAKLGKHGGLKAPKAAGIGPFGESRDDGDPEPLE